MKTAGKVAIGGVAAAIIGGGIFAVTALGVNNIDLAEAAPQSSASYIEINADPSVNQKIAALSLGEKISSITGDKDSKDNNIMKSFSEDDFPGLDYEKDINPWLGDKTANIGFNDDFQNVSVYSIDDKSKAEEAITKVTEKEKAYEVKNKWIIVASDKETLDSYNKSLTSGSTLKDSETFKKDKYKAGDNVAFAWMDLNKMNSVAADKVEGAEDIPEVSGRVTAALSLSGDSVNVEAKTYEVKVDGKNSWVSDQKGVKLLQEFSEDTVGAFEIVDISNNIKNNWNQIEESSPLGDDANSAIEPMENALGIKIPEEIEKLLGNNLALSYNSNSTIDLVSDGADKVTWENLYGFAQGMLGSDEAFGELSTEGSVQKFKYNYMINGDDSSTNKLGDSETFKKALPNLEKSQFAAYVDLDKMIKLDQVEEKENEAVDEGAVGLSASYDKELDEGSLSVKWILR